MVSDLERAGFVLSVPKCRQKPVQVGDWLGFILDLKEGRFMVPEAKVTKLIRQLTAP